MPPSARRYARRAHHHVARVVQVDEEEVREQAAPTGNRHVHADEQRDADERHPVRRVDAQEAMPRVGAQVARGPVGERGRHHRPVEQEARDQEEDLDADVHVQEVGPDVPDVPGERDAQPALVERGRERRVVQHDEQRRARPQAVEAREPLVRGNGGRAHRITLTTAAAAGATTGAAERRGGG